MNEIEKSVPDNDSVAPATAPASENDRTLLKITYFLFALSIIFGLTAIAGVIIAHIKIKDVRGTLLESHYQWLIRTFWIGLAMSVVAMILMWVFVGVVLMLAVAVWYIYRLVKGFLRLNDGKPIEKPTGFL